MKTKVCHQCKWILPGHHFTTEVKRHAVCDVCSGDDGRSGIFLRVWLGRNGVERQRVILIRDGAGLDLRTIRWRGLDFWSALPGRWVWIGEVEV